MPSSADPAMLAPEERPRELAMILARGLVRLRRPQSSAIPVAHSAAEEALKNPANELASVPEQSVTVHGG